MHRPVLRAALTALLVGAGLLAVPAQAAPPAAPAFTPGTVVDLPDNRAASVYVSGGSPHVRVDLVGATHP